jgi:hypothetical protein
VLLAQAPAPTLGGCALLMVVLCVELCALLQLLYQRTTTFSKPYSTISKSSFSPAGLHYRWVPCGLPVLMLVLVRALPLQKCSLYAPVQ